MNCYECIYYSNNSMSNWCDFFEKEDFDPYTNNECEGEEKLLEREDNNDK